MRQIAIVLLLGVLAHAQFSKINSIQVDNQGTPVTGGFFTYPFTFNCGSNMTCTVTGSTVTIAASSTSSTAFSALTAGTNTNAGTFAGSGNTWDFTASSIFKLRVGAGLTTSANGDTGYDSTGKIWHIWQNGADKFSIASSNLGTSGQPCLSNADGSCTFADPVVSQPTASLLNATVVGLGTAGSPSGGVLSVQGVSSGQALPVSGTVTVNAGTNLNTSALALDTSVNGILLSQGSTTSGEKGPLLQGAVTTSAPGYTTAQTSPLSLDTSGNLRTSINNTVTVGGTVTANAGTGTFAVSAASLPLPSGASTSANQTNGSQETEIVQGGNIATVTAASALKVDGSAVTQPVSGTITANAGTGTFTVAGATTDGSTTEIPFLAVGGESNDATAQYQPIPLGTGGRSVIVEGVSGGTTVPVSGTITANAGSGTFNIQGNASVNVNQVAGNAVTTATTGMQEVGVADSGGNGLTSNSTTFTSKHGLDINLLGTLGTAFTTAGLVDIKGADGNVFVRQTTAANLNATAVQGNAGSNAQAWWAQIGDTAHGPVAVKGSNVAPLLADVALTTNISPNNSGLPVNVPVSTKLCGNVTASGTTVTCTATPTTGDTIIGLCGVNTTSTLVFSDNNSNTYTIAKSQTGTNADALVDFAVNANSGSTTFTCTAGSSGVVSITVYDVSGLLAQIPAQPDQTDSKTATSQTSAVTTNALNPTATNEIAFTAIELTANNSCTAGTNWTLDTQEGATGGNLCPEHQAFSTIGTYAAASTLATFTSSTYAQATATFRPVIVGVEGSFDLWAQGVPLAQSSYGSTPSGNALAVNADVTNTVATNLAQINGTTVSQSNGASGNGDQRINVASDNSAIANWGHGATGSAAPSGATQAGFVAHTALPSPLSDGQTTGGMADKFGRQVVWGQCPRDLVGHINLANTTPTSATSFISAGGTGVFNDITALIVTNRSSTGFTLTLTDNGSGGNSYTFNVGNQQGAGFVIPFNPPLIQGTSAAAWDVLESTSAAFDINAVYCKDQ